MPDTRCKLLRVMLPKALEGVPIEADLPSPVASAKASTEQMDPLEKAEAAKEKKSASSEAAPEGMVGGDELDKAIGDKGGKGADPEVTSADDDPLEKAEAAKES